MVTSLTGSRAQSLVMGGVALGVLYIVSFAILASGVLARAPDQIAFAATLNLAVTATMVAWWLGVRRSALPSWVAVAVFGWGAVVARVWVPHAPLGMLVAIGGVVELVMMGWLVLRISRRWRRSPR
jgi:hypothetical protein